MTTHVALLRAINVGGRNRVSTSELRDLLAELGFANVQSLLQSGNLVFDGRAGTPRGPTQALRAPRGWLTLGCMTGG